MPCEVVLLRVDIFKMAAVAMETAKMERDKQKISESVGQTLPQLPWEQKRGIKNIFGFLSSNFMKLCRNIHRSVWQLLGG